MQGVVLAQGVNGCVYEIPKQFDTVIWHLSRYEPPSPFTKELHNLIVVADNK